MLGIGPEEYATVRLAGLGEQATGCLLFTDGLWDARSREGEPFGRARLKAYFADTLDRDLTDVVNGLLSRVTAHLHGADFEDDFTVLAVERTA